MNKRGCRKCDGTGWKTVYATDVNRPVFKVIPCDCAARYQRTAEGKARCEEIASLTVAQACDR